ncbi:MAG: hypothetical protein QM488_12700 [Rhizobiaceae bacterium]
MCDRPLDRPIAAEDLTNLPGVNTRQAAIISRLIESIDETVTHRELFAAVYGEPQDGGPLSSQRVIRDNVRMARKALKPFGWQIPNIPWIGYRICKIGQTPDFGRVGMSEQDYQDLPESLQHEARLMRREIGSPYFMSGKSLKRVAVAACAKAGSE